MAVTTDIVQTWRNPRAVYRRLLAVGQREDRAIAMLMAACFLVFVAQWPRLVRTSQGIDLPSGTEVPGLDRLMSYEFMSWLMIWPLGFYALAALMVLALRVFGSKLTGYGGRLALFWALLAATPAMILFGLLRGLNGDVVATKLAGAVWIVALVVFWVQGLRVAAEHEKRAISV